MVTVSSLRMSLVADTTRFKAGLDSAQALLAKAEQEVEKRSSTTAKEQQAQATKTQQLAQDRVKQGQAFVATQKDMLKAAAKGFVLYRGAQAAMGQIRGGLSDAMLIETTEAQFRTMTGSAERAKSLMSELRQFDAQTTFGFTDTVQGAMRLMNYGVAASDVTDVLKRLGDISGGSADRLHGLTLAFGQATSLGRLQREEVNQMVERGFNPMMEITKLTGETMEELSARMQKGGVSAGELRMAIEAATSAGGRFFGLMEERSKSTAGQIDLLRGEWEMLRADFATEIGLPAAGVAAQGGNWLMKQFKRSREGWADIFSQGRFNPGAATLGEFFQPSRTLGGNAKANKVLMDLASFEARERMAIEKREAERRAGQERLFATGKSLGMGLTQRAMDTASSFAGLMGAAATNAAPGLMGIGRDALLRSSLSDLQRQYDGIQDPQSRSIGPATTATRGSREEFQARSEMARAREEKAVEARRHEEAQTKRQQLLDAMNDIRKKLDMPTLVPGI